MVRAYANDGAVEQGRTGGMLIAMCGQVGVILPSAHHASSSRLTSISHVHILRSLEGLARGSKHFKHTERAILVSSRVAFSAA